MDEKPPQQVRDDNASASSFSMTEKASAMQASRDATPSVQTKDETSQSVHTKDGSNLTATDTRGTLKKVSTAKEAQAELNRIMSSGEGIDYPSGLKLALISIALCLSVFLMALDNTIIATAIPAITNQFHSQTDIGWYGSAYLLTTASFQLLFGKFYTFFSIKWVYLTAIAIFEVGSLICGVAPNSVTLIVGRAIAGIGSAGIFSGALIIVAYTVPLAKRPMYTGFIGAMYGIASVAGPLLGGVFTDKATWRWCFYINLPIGAITVAFIVFFFHSPPRAALADLGWKVRLMEFDPFGTLAFMPAIICLLLALKWGGTEYAWKDGRIIALFVIFGVLIMIFIGIQFWKQDSATIPPSIMKNRSMAAASWYTFFFGSFFLALVYFLPIWFQAVKGASAFKSGIMNLPMILTLVIVSVLSGIGVTIVGYYAPLMIASSVIASIGVGLMYTFTPESNHSYWMGYQAITGIGIGLGMQQPLIAVQTVLDISLVPIGTSIIIFLQTLGGALFVSIGQNIYSNKLVEGLKLHAPELDPLLVLNTGATAIQKSVDKASLKGVTLAYNNALTQVFLAATVMASLTIIGSVAIEWKSVKGKKIEMAAA